MASTREIRGEQSCPGRVFVRILRFLHQRYKPAFILMLLLPEGKPGETWEPSKQATLRRKSDNTAHEGTFTFHFSLQRVNLLATLCHRNKLRYLLTLR